MPSGQPGQPITLTAADGERVIVSGMEDMTGWQPYAGSIYTTLIDWDPVELYVHFDRQSLAREPNEGWWSATSVDNNGSGGVVSLTDTVHLKGFTKDLTGGSVYVWSQWGNVFFRCPIVSLDPGTGKLEFQRLQSYMVLTAGDYYYLEDQVSLIDRPGEWASAPEGANHRVYFQPAVSGDLAATQGNRMAPRVIDANSVQHAVLQGLEITGAIGDGIYVSDADDVNVYDCIFHDNTGIGLEMRYISNAEVLNNIAARNRFGIQLEHARSVTVEGNEVSRNEEDGFRVVHSSADITVRRNYMHHHQMWGHPDNMQMFGGVTNVLFSENLLLGSLQSLMTQEAVGMSLMDNVVVGSEGYQVIFGHGNSGFDDVIGNTLAFAGYGCLRMTWTDYNVQGNVFMTGNKEAAYGTYESDNYTGDYNLFWNAAREPNPNVLVSDGPVWHKSLAAFQAATGQDLHSAYADPQFVNAPIGFGVLDVNYMDQNTAATLYLRGGHQFLVGDHVEVDFDGVVRSVTAVNGNAITVSPVLDEKPLKAWIVLDWGADTNFNLDLSLAAGSPGIGLGSGGTTVGSSVSVPDYQAGDFDGDGMRDLPDVPPDLDL